MTDDTKDFEKKTHDDDFGNLDDFLNDTPGHEAEAFPLDDANDDEMFMPEKKKKNGLLTTVALIALLGGGVYAGMQYLPGLMQDPELAQFEEMMQDRSAQIEQGFAPAPAPIAPSMPQASPNDLPPAMADDFQQQDLPVAADTMPTPPDDVIFADDMNNDMMAMPNDPFGNNRPDEISNAMADSVTENVAVPTANSIAEIVAIAEETTEAIINDPQGQPQENIVITDDVIILEGETDEDILPEVTENDNFMGDDFTRNDMSEDNGREIIRPSNSLRADDMAFMNNEPVNDTMTGDEEVTADVMGTATNVTPTEDMSQLNENSPSVMEMPEEITGVPGDDITETAPTPPTQIVQPEPVVDPIMLAAPIMESVVDTPTPRAPEPVPAVEVVEEVEPVKATPVTPTQTVAKKKAEPVKRTDPRVSQARAAFESGDYQSALNLYEAVLAEDAGNTAALTGRQLSRAKLRTLPNNATANVQQGTLIPEMRQAPVSATIQQALSRAQSNPRDAVAAANLAKAYAEQGQNSDALEWYRKALQLDAIYKSDINRMAIYDAMGQLN